MREHKLLHTSSDWLAESATKSVKRLKYEKEEDGIIRVRELGKIDCIAIFEQKKNLIFITLKLYAVKFLRTSETHVKL